MVNFVVVALSFLGNGEKVFCPLSARVGAPLTALQKTMVSEVEAAVKQWSPTGFFSEELACGRKGTELSDLVARVRSAAAGLAVPAYGAGPVPRAHMAGRQGFLPVVADRIKLPGAPADVDLSEWLTPELWMAYVEPKSLRSLPRRPVTWARPLPRRASAEELKLMQKWQRAGRLLLSEAGAAPSHRSSVLAAVAKSAVEDRQIIDRRGANGEEDKIFGPSVFLPAAVDLCEIELDASEKLACAGSDLAHCYHHIAVSQERAVANPIGKPLAPDQAAAALLGDFFLPEAALAAQGVERLGGRAVEVPLRVRGGALPLRGATGPVSACFDGLPMGDHGAVEFVHAAHGELLRHAGLLGAKEVLGGRPLPDGGEFHLRCIDDLKVLVKVPRDVDLSAKPEDRSRADRAALDAALAAYRSAGWPVSEGKVVRDTEVDLVLGGEVLGDVGHLGAPRDRRFVLAVLLLLAARSRWISVASMEALLGNLTYVLLFRRPLLSLLQAVFGYTNLPRNALLFLPRRTADELILAALLLPMAFTDLRAPTVAAVWSSDASPAGGGFCRAEATKEQAQSLYRLRERRGGYSKLESPARVVLRELGVLGTAGSEEEAVLFPSLQSVAKPLAYSYDFLEVFAGCPAVSAALARRGLRVGPALEVSASRWFDLRDSRVLEWLVWLVSERRVKAVLFAPAATAFEARPLPGPSCSRRRPSLLAPSTWDSNRLADFALFLLRCCRRCGVVGIDEMICFGKLKRALLWEAVAAKNGLDFWSVSPCAYGLFVRRSSFFLSTGVDYSDVAGRCEGFHGHLPADPCCASSLASLWPPFADALVGMIVAGVRTSEADFLEANDPYEKQGFERIAVNVLADTLDWKVERRWRWKQPGHINLLEQRALHAFIRERVRKGESGRCVVFVDSRVALCSGAKGRSPSLALGARWRASLPWLIGGALYLGLLFVPTRKNPADAPSRLRPLSTPAGSPPASWRRAAAGDLGGWRRWLGAPLLSRARAGWAQLCLRLLETRLRKDELQSWPPPPVATDGEAAQPGPRESNWMPRPELPLQREALLAPREVEKRRRMLEEFVAFLGSVDLESLCARPSACAAALEAFGRDLYRQVPRRPIADYARAILAVVDGHRVLRRQLTQAWDFATVWRMEEPGANNLAMPPVVVRAFVAVALFWKWPRFAAMVGLGFAGLLRPSEYLLATRRLLVLPEDIQGDWFRCYIRVPSPKSRWAAARRQLARVDDWWVTALVSRLYRDVAPEERLWPASPAAFRRRWNAVADALGLDRRQGSGLTPASLRAGGATAHYERWEDAERLRRRGRWQKLQTVEIYVQEIAPYEFLANLKVSHRNRVFAVARYLDKLLWDFLEPEAADRPRRAAASFATRRDATEPPLA